MEEETEEPRVPSPNKGTGNFLTSIRNAVREFVYKMIAYSVSTFSGVLLMMAVDNYPYITFRALGAFHLLVGLLFIIEGAIATGFLAAFAMIDFNPLKLPHPLDWSLTWAHNISPIAFGILVSHNFIKKNHFFVIY